MESKANKLDLMSASELRAICSDRRIRPNGRFPSHCKKNELIQALINDGYLGESKPAETKPVKPAETKPVRSAETKPADVGNAFLDLMGNAFSSEIERALPLIENHVDNYIAEHSESFTKKIEIKIGDKTNEIEGTIHEIAVKVAQTITAGMDVLLVGSSGCGKTYLARQISEMIGVRFGSMSITAGISEAYLLGRFIPGEGGNYQYRPAPFVDFYQNGGLYLLDEIDAGDPNVLLVINSALANGHLSLPDGTTIKRHDDFHLIATGNTWGSGANRIYSGRSQLDAATLDRFTAATFLMDYDRKLEKDLCAGNNFAIELFEWVGKVRDVVSDNKIRRVVSTRYLVNGIKLLAAGVSLEEVKERLYVSWNEQEVQVIKSL
jgi:MoxR-like ATPase